MEVDASDTGVGASHNESLQTKNSSADRNYNIGKRELLAVKLALEEWRHWLEGAEHSFFVWTDHNNISYIQTAKRLNSLHAWWALFFGQFNFTLTYRLGSRNSKPEALSHQYVPDKSPTNPDTIVPSSCVLASIRFCPFSGPPLGTYFPVHLSSCD